MQNIVSFNCSAKYYAEHWREMAPEPPASCPLYGCDGYMQGNGCYPRSVIDCRGCCVLLWVFRFRCVTCGRTVSFLPDFCVPYKQFSVEVVGAALWAVLVLNLATQAVAAADSVYNKASFSRYCVYNWVRQFCCNSHNLWHIGLVRLGVAAVPVADSEALLLKCLAGFPVGPSAHAPCDLRAAQCALSTPFPPFGLFRAHLLPGCCT